LTVNGNVSIGAATINTAALEVSSQGTTGSIRFGQSSYSTNIGGSFYATNSASYYGIGTYYDGANWRATSTSGASIIGAAANVITFYTNVSPTIGGIIAATNRVSIDGSGNMYPGANNAQTLGSTTANWSTVYAVTFSGTSTTAKYADLAEKYIADCDLLPGDVVVFGGLHEITKTTISHDDRIAGIVSTNPAYLMNSDAAGYPIGLQGRLPCRVLGPINKGQSLVSSTIAGVAQALDKTKYTPGCIIGKSLEEITTDDIQTIEVVVGRL